MVIGRLVPGWSQINRSAAVPWSPSLIVHEKKDPHDDWPSKGIVLTSPWNLEVHSYHEGFEEHETQLDFVRQEAIRPEDFEESSLPAELLSILKEDGYEEPLYPNVINASVSGATLEEAIEKMRVKLRLLEHGYILMDTYFYTPRDPR